MAFAPDVVVVNCGGTYSWSKVGGFERAYGELIAVCRLEMAKAVDLALRVFALPQWRDRAWRYEIWGTGPDQAYLEELAEYLGIAKRVRFVGHAADLRAVWERNHVLVLVSRIEGLPLALVEASICGRPSIVTDVGGIRRWAADGDFAFIAAGPSLHAV